MVVRKLSAEVDIFDAEGRVAEGAVLLDWRMPGWRLLMDIDHLDISDQEWCVLGQLFGDYDTGVDALELTGAGVRFGFFYTPGEIASPEGQRILRQVWIAEITKTA
jgi:hypothetical protein